jgi:mRNA interferase MazF
MVKKYIPKQGDIVYLDFNPTMGHEQNVNRPAIVVSLEEFNKFTKMAIVCPISTNTKLFPTHFNLKDTKKIKGSVFCEHIRSIDYEERKVKYIEKASDSDLNFIIKLINACIEE